MVVFRWHHVGQRVVFVSDQALRGHSRDGIRRGGKVRDRAAVRDQSRHSLRPGASQPAAAVQGGFILHLAEPVVLTLTLSVVKYTDIAVRSLTCHTAT